MSSTDNPNDLLIEARRAARAVEAHWRGYRDAKAGEAALKALRRYMNLDALVSQGRVELPDEWANATPVARSEPVATEEEVPHESA